MFLMMACEYLCFYGKFKRAQIYRTYVMCRNVRNIQSIFRTVRLFGKLQNCENNSRNTRYIYIYIYRERGGGARERDRAVNGFMTSCPSIIIIRFDDTVRALVSRVCRSHVLDYHQIAYLSIVVSRCCKQSQPGSRINDAVESWTIGAITAASLWHSQDACSGP